MSNPFIYLVAMRLYFTEVRLRKTYKSAVADNQQRI